MSRIANASRITQQIERRPRPCDACGSQDLQVVWDYDHRQKTRNGQFCWQVSNVLCRQCGFAFVSPVPTDEALKAYYQDCFPLYGSGYYSVANRLAILDRYQRATSCRPSRFVEIGGNSSGEFSEALTTRFDLVHNIEINDACRRDSDDSREIPAGSAHFVASYFVMEHVPDPRGFFEECVRLAHPDEGVVLVEVPDLHQYPRDISALVFHEHVNHFSPATLTALAAQSGLELLEISHAECSRPFGFTAVYRRSPHKAGFAPPNRAEYCNALACIRGGLHLRDHAEQKMKAERQWLETAARSGRRMVVWGANAICNRLLAPIQLPNNVVVVDRNPDKVGFIEGHRVQVPELVRDHLLQTEIFVICVKTNVTQIVTQLRDEFGVDVDRVKIRVPDTIP